MAEIPAETPIKYDDICQVVGHLYLDSFHQRHTMETHFKAMLSQLQAQNATLMQEVKMLEQDNGV